MNFSQADLNDDHTEEQGALGREFVHVSQVEELKQANLRLWEYVNSSDRFYKSQIDKAREQHTRDLHEQLDAKERLHQSELVTEAQRIRDDHETEYQTLIKEHDRQMENQANAHRKTEEDWCGIFEAQLLASKNHIETEIQEALNVKAELFDGVWRQYSAKMQKAQQKMQASADPLNKALNNVKHCRTVARSSF